MASDKLMNHTQGETIITKLTSIADSLDDLAAVTPAKLGMGIATCDTAASTAAKTAALANFALVEGAPVSVKFTYANTATNATLNINNTGAKPIIYKNAAIGNDVISAGDTCTFIYTTNTYKITNIDTLTGPGSGTVRQVGAENGLITDQTDNADIQTTGNIGLNLKSTTKHVNSVGNPEDTDQIYPVQLDKDGVPCVAVPWIEYTQGDGINISENNVITNTGVFDVTTPTSSDTSATNGDIKVTKKVVNNGVTSDSVTFVKPKGINDPAFKALDSSTSGLTADDNHVPTSKTVQDAIDTALASASVYKGTIAAFNDLPTSTATVIVRKGWYYRVSTAWAVATGTPATHVGDIIIAEIDSPSKSIDGTNWSLLHNEANTDANVAQSPVSTNANYEVLFSGSADNTAHTEGTGKDSGLTYNPSTNKLTVSGEVSASSYSGLPDGNITTKGIVQLGTDADKAASGSHGHGNITNGGAITADAVDLASGDALVFADSSDSSKLKKASITFDGSTATQALTKKGTWETFNNYTHPDTAGNKHIPTNGATGNYLKYGGSSGTASWAAPLTSWPATPTNTDTLPSTKLLDDRFKTNESNILSVQNDIAELNSDFVVAAQNINYAISTGGKNLLSKFQYYDNADKVTVNADGSITLNAPASSYDTNIHFAVDSDGVDRYKPMPAEWVGKYFSGIVTANNAVIWIMEFSDDGSTWKRQLNIGSVNQKLEIPNDGYYKFTFKIAKNNAVSNYTFKPMIADEVVYDTIGAGQPPALPNSDLTVLEAEDRTALAEEIDAGAKNKYIPRSQTQAGITATVNSDNSLNVTWTAIGSSNEYCRINNDDLKLPVGTYVFSGLTESGNLNYYLHLEDSSGAIIGNIMSNTPNRCLEFKVTDATKNYKVYVAVTANSAAQSTAKKIYPMICTKAAFGVSNKFVPYRPNYDLVQYMLPKSKTVSFNVTEANTYQIVSDLSIALPSGYAAQVSATAWRETSTPYTPASGIRIFTDSTGTSVLNESTVAVNESPVTQQLGLSTTTVVKNIGGNSLPVYVAVRYPAAVSIRVTIFYTIVPGSRDT